MISDKYYSFNVNDEEFILEKKKLMKYGFFKTIFQNKFKSEITNINFNIDSKLINIAHNLNINKQLDINQITQIYDYLDYLTPIDKNNNLIKLERLYKPIDSDYDIIKQIIDKNFKYLLIKKYINNITIDHIDKFDNSKFVEYCVYLKSLFQKYNINIDNLKLDRHIHGINGGYYGCDGKPYLFVDNQCLFSYWHYDDFDNNLKKYIIDNLNL